MSNRNTIEQMRLPLANEVIVVHCFFKCAHVVQSADPQTAHDLMERHYADKHSRQIDRIVMKYGVR